MGIVIPPILSAFLHICRKLRERRDEARTKRLIDGLPRSIQKDLGWPDGYAVKQENHWTLSSDVQKR